MTPPSLTVIAGANGCGKSTLTRWGKAFVQQSAILDPDAVAVELQARSDSASSKIDAGKEVLRAARQLLAQRVSFSIETTLSGGTYLRMLQEVRQLHYRTRLIYIGTQSIEINIARVRARVLQGGHDVPLDDQRRRYPRSFKNLQAAIRLADQSILFDNSTEEGPRLVGLKLEGREMVLTEPLPLWAAFLRS